MWPFNHDKAKKEDEYEKALYEGHIHLDKLVEFEKKWHLEKPGYTPMENTLEKIYWDFYQECLVEEKRREAILK